MDQHEATGATGRLQWGPEEAARQELSALAQERGQTSPIAHRYDELERAVDEIGVLLDRLRSKIEPVLGPDMTESSPENATPDQPQESDLATALHSRTRELRRYARALRSLTDRVEL